MEVVRTQLPGSDLKLAGPQRHTRRQLWKKKNRVNLHLLMAGVPKLCGHTL